MKKNKTQKISANIRKLPDRDGTVLFLRDKEVISVIGLGECGPGTNTMKVNKCVIPNFDSLY